MADVAFTMPVSTGPPYGAAPPRAQQYGGGQPPGAAPGLSFLPTTFGPAGGTGGSPYGTGAYGGAPGGAPQAAGAYGGGGYGRAGFGGGEPSFEDEPPLLEELGVDVRLIYRKTLSVLHPFAVDERLLDDGDLAGPLLMCLALASLHLLSGKLHFGVVLGWSVLFACGLYWLFSLLASGGNAPPTAAGYPPRAAGEEGAPGGGPELYRCASLIGYCLLPMVVFAALGLVLPKRMWLLGPLGLGFAAWSTRAATERLVRAAPALAPSRGLVAAPLLLTYLVYGLLTVY